MALVAARIPDYARAVIREETARMAGARLRAAALALSERYRSGGEIGGGFAVSPADRLAYLAVRAPATYAVSRAVFAEARRLHGGEMKTLLDLGAGPGTALWAAAEEFPRLDGAVLVESDAGWIDLGRRIARAAPYACVAAADWRRADLPEQTVLPPRDVVVMSYFLGEVEREKLERLAVSAWEATREILVCIEPGSRRGFDGIRRVREILLRRGARVLAPCTHEQTCPMVGDDWCHFSRRVAREAEHRRAKAAVLPYEDEKFSYAVFCGKTVAAGGRLVRRPIKSSGHVSLDVCASGEIRRIVVGRGQKTVYRRARDARWGDIWAGNDAPEPDPDREQ